MIDLSFSSYQAKIYCMNFQSENNNKKASLPRFLTELDLSSVEVSAESGESLKRIVKRLAPEKNGEYQVYQGFECFYC